METSLSRCGHTSTDLAISIAGGVDEKKEIKNMLKSVKVEDFLFLNGKIHYVIINGALSGHSLIFSTH